MALERFTERIRPQYTLSYHTKGEEIYWRFYQDDKQLARDRRLADALSQATGYSLAEAKDSVGGYKDWCIQQFAIPSFTIEVGLDRWAHPLGENALAEIVKKNRDALAVLSNAYGKNV
jgi:g-D-glutamyl-meso-diaminopimelate peptidase